MSNGRLGEFEEQILLAVCGLREEAYAVPVQRRIQVAASRRVTMGSVYATLDRLEKKGYLRSRMGPATNRPGGKAKRFYEVTGSGMAAMGASQEARRELVAFLSPDLLPRLGYSL